MGHLYRITELFTALTFLSALQILEQMIINNNRSNLHISPQYNVQDTGPNSLHAN